MIDATRCPSLSCPRSTSSMTLVAVATGLVIDAISNTVSVVIGSSLERIEGGGATLVVKLAQQLESVFGAAGPLVKWAFLAGAWGTVFTSMLGVWQSVPYLFADLWQLIRGHGKTDARVDVTALPYQAYLYAIATVPIFGLVAFNFQSMQKVYAVVGALFIPMLAAVLLVLNGRPDWVGEQNRNSRWTTAALIGALVFFLLAGAVEIRDSLFPT